ncbi:MAG: SufD family Fe-S cluster assembly protein [Lachnospiraceae bacterium]|nr:SufD family Fe-S cluster assembly protein [Lachnospiraceae bacterium]
MDQIQKRIIEEVADLHEVPEGAFNFRIDGQSDGRRSTANIQIESKKDKSGIDIYIKPGTKNESVHIPVVLSISGIKETVYNDFYVGEGADVVIVAGCGISNCGNQDSQHDGIHTFHIEKNARVKYVEKHYGEGDGNGKRILNPQTVVDMAEDTYLEMEMVQIKGVDSTIRTTNANLGKGAQLIVHERLMTHGNQTAVSEYDVNLNGEGASANLVSRSVGRDTSKQTFISRLFGNAQANGHSECDSIIMDDARINSIPEVAANHPEAMLIHEAAIGKIAGEQLIKLMTMGLSEKEAEDMIIRGFLR